MSTMALLHLVENTVAPAGLQARLDANAVLGWRIIHIIWTGASFSVVWQKTAQV